MQGRTTVTTMGDLLSILPQVEVDPESFCVISTVGLSNPRDAGFGVTPKWEADKRKIPELRH